MKLTKFVHSCVLAESGGQAVLFDPGIFSWNGGVIDVDKLPEVQTIIVSHKHPDHMGEPFVRALATKFPQAQWLAPPDAHDDLRSFGVQKVSDKSTASVTVTVGDHAHVAPFGGQVQNLVAHWQNVTSPGDTHDIATTKDILLLPVQAPWGTTIRAVELAQALKPKFILPIHDWMWNDDWRNNCYDRFEQIFNDSRTTFLRPTDGQPLTVAL